MLPLCYFHLQWKGEMTALQPEAESFAALILPKLFPRGLTWNAVARPVGAPQGGCQINKQACFDRAEYRPLLSLTCCIGLPVH